MKVKIENSLYSPQARKFSKESALEMTIYWM